MDLDLRPEDAAFRDDVRAFLAANVPDTMRRAHDLTTSFIDEPAMAIDLHRALARRGWSVPQWPVEHGGAGWTPVQRYIFDVECGRAGAPTHNSSGTSFI